MKFTTFIKRYGIVAYMTSVISSIIFSRLGFEIISPVVISIIKALYFVILISGIISFYYSRRKNAIAIASFFLPVVLMFTDIPFKVVTMILVLPLFFSSEVKTSIGGIGATIYILLISIGIYGISLGDFGVNTIINQQDSPDGMYRVVTIDNDKGALGGNTYVEVERIYFGLAKKNIKTLYHGHWGEKPKIEWIDNNNVNINGNDVNIYK